MAAAPFWKVYVGGSYVAATRDVEDAAVIVASRGRGEIRADHRLVVWREGGEAQSAAESYDFVARVAKRRLDEHRERVAMKRAAARVPR